MYRTQSEDDSHDDEEKFLGLEKMSTENAVLDEGASGDSKEDN